VKSLPSERCRGIRGRVARGLRAATVPGMTGITLANVSSFGRTEPNGRASMRRTRTGAGRCGRKPPGWVERLRWRG
jgi:hypothetical protein